jgi:SAM-dependent methyltransferase
MGCIYIQYGCGLDAPEEWLNYDASPTLHIQRIPWLSRVIRMGVHFPKNTLSGDIVKGLPLNDQSADAIYCSHVLEHLSLYDFKKALVNTHKILKPGGLFRLVVPDFEQLVTDYQQDSSNLAAETFMRNTGIAVEIRARNFIGFIREYLGNSRHLWLWDYSSLVHYLEQTGFSQIRRAQYGDSELSAYTIVENVDRWNGSLGIECRRA